MVPYHNSQLDDLATRLFKAFARFAYALKAAGFHTGNGDAMPDWRAFALSVEGVLVHSTSESVREALDYMLSHPPT